MSWEPKGAHPMPPPQEILCKGLYLFLYIYIYLLGGVALAPFLPAQAEQTALVASLQKELAHVKEDGLMGGDDRVISLSRAPGKDSGQRRIIEKFKGPCFAYGFLTHLIPKSLRPNTLLLINNIYMRWF